MKPSNVWKCKLHDRTPMGIGHPAKGSITLSINCDIEDVERLCKLLEVANDPSAKSLRNFIQHNGNLASHLRDIARATRKG